MGVCSSGGMRAPLTMMMAHPSGRIASSSSRVHCCSPISPTSPAIEIQAMPCRASAKRPSHFPIATTPELSLAVAASSLPVSVVDAVALRRCPTGLACCAGASAGHLADSPVTEYLRFRGSITTATDDQLSSPDMLSIAASRHSRSSLPRRFESTIRLDVGRIAVERAARSLRNSQASMAPLTSPARTTRWLRQPCAPPWPNPTACVNGGLVGRQYGGPLAGPRLVPHLGRI